MFYQLLFIHLYRPFLKYNHATSPLPSHVSPRKVCTHAAATISKHLRLYKRTHGLRQICNIAVYIAHSACTIHLLNLPDKNAKRDITHGVKHLEEIAESWLCARRTLGILSTLTRQWKIEMPEEAATVLARTDAKFDILHADHQHSTRSATTSPPQAQCTPSPGHYSDRNSAVNCSIDSGDYPRAVLSTQRKTTLSAKAPNGNTSAPAQLTAEPQPMNRHNRYEISQAQEDLWNHDVASRGSMASAQMSPSTLFGGVEALVQDSDGWWVKDNYVFHNGFANWNGMDSDMSLLGGAGATNGFVADGNNVNSFNVRERDMYL